MSPRGAGREQVGDGTHRRPQPAPDPSGRARTWACAADQGLAHASQDEMCAVGWGDTGQTQPRERVRSGGGRGDAPEVDDCGCLTLSCSSGEAPLGTRVGRVHRLRRDRACAGHWGGSGSEGLAERWP